MSHSLWQDQSSSKALKTYDVVVVGAGIAGLSVAYWLKKEDPDLKVAVLEKGELASGATGRNAGFITCGSVEHFNRLVERWGENTATDIWQFSEDNLRLLKEEIIGDIKDPVLEIGFEDKGSFSLASTEAEFSELKLTAGLMAQRGIAVETLSESEIRSRLGVEQFCGGIKYVGDASVNPVALCGKLKDQLDSVDFFFHHEVGRIEENGESRKVYTNKGLFECSAVILAGNGYLPTLNKYFSDKVYPTRGQILAIEKVPSFMEGPCYANFVLDYFRQLPSGEVLIGGFRQLEKDTEVGYSDHTTEKIQEALYQFLQKHLPILKDKKVTHRWAGVMGFSHDGQPFVGALPGDSQVYFLGGFTAHGLGLAFHSAKKLVDSMYGREIPGFLSAKRF